MIATHADARAAEVAATIGEPARARMLYALSDGRARTSTELAVMAGVTASTASLHLQRMRAQRLVRVSAQGKHRYYTLASGQVAAALEALSVLAAGGPSTATPGRPAFEPNTPHQLRFARTCYDHLAGRLGVLVNDRLRALGWLTGSRSGDDAYTLTAKGAAGLAAMGVDVEAARARRRRLAYACVDWSERRPHLGGALAASLLALAVERRWVRHEADDRALGLTRAGRLALGEHLQLSVDEPD